MTTPSLHPEAFCLRCESPESMLGSFFCQACDTELRNPSHTAPGDQGKPVAKRTGPRPPRRIGYLAEGK